MKVILLSVLLGSVAYCQKTSFIQLPALESQRHANIEKRYISEIECIKKLDRVLQAQWTEELNNIPTQDLTDLPKVPWQDKESFFLRYNSMEDQWLMEEGSPTNKINECVEDILSDIGTSAVYRSGLHCITELLNTNSYEEILHGRDFEQLVNHSASEQLPFRKFITFPEILELIFQNRDPTTWTNVETVLYSHAKVYVLTDVDNHRRQYIASQNCDWVDAAALREAPTEAARLNEFTSQVRHSVNKQLAGRLVKSWNLNRILPTESYYLWLDAHREMLSSLEREVKMLRNQNKDPQWLCEHAAELATNFTDVQSSILLTEDETPVHLEASDVASMARTIEKALAEANDTRHSTIKSVADKQDNRTRCLSSLVRLVQNHRRFDLASVFIDEEYEFPEVYCENTSKNLGMTRFTLCDCIGSFCNYYDLVALFAEEYSLVKGSDGIYKIVRSGITSKRKVYYCHILSNSSRDV